MITSKNAARGLPHVPTDDLSILLSMIEAMDDTLLVFSSIPSLMTASRAAERFQATYGWETCWPKTVFYAYRSPEFPPNTSTPQNIQIPSVDLTNPSSSYTSLNDVPVITDHTTFLRVPINRPDIHFSHLQDIILNFSFPYLYRPLPLTALRRILSQCIVSKIRPLLAYQNITLAHATKLDHLIANKVHQYLGFPFSFNSLLLTAPINLRGFGFPSISRINDSLAVSGLQRDLNHHVSTFKNLAATTLNDWTCQLNHCINPLNKPDCQRSFLRTRNKIPYSWVHAQSVMRKVKLSFCATDLSYILMGNISLYHLYQLSTSYSSSVVLPYISSQTFTNFARCGYTCLSHVGRWQLNIVTSLPYDFLPHNVSFSPDHYLLSRDWPIVLQWLRSLPSVLHHLTYPSAQLLYPRETRRQIAETTLLALPTFTPNYPNDIPPNIFASDASMIQKNRTPSSSVTFAVVGNNTALVASLNDTKWMTNILHGEVYGILTASLMMLKSLLRPLTSSPSLYSDHLNSVTLLDGNRPHPYQLSSNPARSLLADNLASHRNTWKSLPPAAPSPTFFMDDYTPYTENSGFIEQNIFSFVDTCLAKAQITQVPSLSSSILLPCCYNSDPPPEYAYTRALSAYSAVVQLYLRTGQLDTALTRSSRLNDDSQPWCRFGCSVLEDPHHIFVDCPRFNPYRRHATDELLASTRAILDTFKTPAHIASRLTQIVKGLTLDSEVWPLHKSFFYHGVIPALDQIIPSSSPNQPQNTTCARLRARLASEWHYGCIKLAARI
ncbi:hypothetical protein BDZ97DRAFT_1740218, partial [Flammula alnicola]